MTTISNRRWYSTSNPAVKLHRFDVHVVPFGFDGPRAPGVYAVDLEQADRPTVDGIEGGRIVAMTIRETRDRDLAVYDRRAEGWLVYPETSDLDLICDYVISRYS